MKKTIDVARFSAGIVAVAAAALALVARGADEARVRAVADEIGGAVTWSDSRSQPSRVRGEALWMAPARKAGKLAGGGAALAPSEAAMAAMKSLGEMWGVTDPAASLTVRSADADRFGFTHVRLRQIYNGIEVDGRELIVHLNAAGNVYEVNGEFLEGLSISTKPTVTAASAASAAMNAAKAAGAKSPSASAEDAALAVWCDGSDATKARLAWKVLVRGGGRRGRAMLWFVDAKTGKAVHARPASVAQSKATARIESDDLPIDYNKIITTATTMAFPSGEAVAITNNLPKQHGGAEVIVPAILAEDGKRYLVGTSSNGVEFGVLDGFAAPAFRAAAKTAFKKGNASWFKKFHEKSQWTAWNPENPKEDAANALAILRNIGLTLDYIHGEFGRNSYDGNGGRIALWRFWQGDFDDIDDGFANAFWTNIDDKPKMPGCLFFGYDDSGNRSETSLDTCAHEFTHGITAWTADLQYEKESGALNESFSDLIAAACEFKCQPSADDTTNATNPVPGKADWLFDEDSGEVSRSYADPHLYEQPSRYKGSDWHSTIGKPDDDNDFGGVHSNSGVQNHFFYLLSEGGNGSNDGLEYEPFTGIGVEKAAQIAYRTLTAYCGPRTDYGNVVSCWQSAAADLVESGDITEEDAEKVDRAWNAVLSVPDIDMQFAKPAVTTTESSTPVVEVWGGNATNKCTVKVYLVPGSVTASRFSKKVRSLFPITLTWNAGEVGKQAFKVPVLSDSVVTGDRSFYLQLVSPTGAQLGTNSLCEVTVEDIDTNAKDLLQTTLLTRGLVARPLMIWGGGSEPFVMPLSWIAVREPPALEYFWTVDMADMTEGTASLALSGFKGKGKLSFEYKLVTPAEPDPESASTLTVTDKESGAAKVSATPSTSDEWVTASISYTKNTSHGLSFSYKAVTNNVILAVKDVRWTPAGSGAMCFVEALSEFEEAGYTLGSGYYAKKSTATLTAKANPGWTFAGWYTIDDKLYSKAAKVSFKVTKGVKLYAGFLPSAWVGAIPDTAAGGSVSGTGHYVTGANVTLKAKPAKGYVFAGWYVDGEFVSAKVSLPWIADDLGAPVPHAKFITAKSDLNSMKLAVDGAAETAWKKSGVLLTRGLAANVPLDASGTLAVSVSVSGLPKGLSYSKALGAITGVPTVASTVKKGKTVPTKVKVTLKSAGGTVKKYTLPITVQNLPASVRGTFNGGWDHGQATFTVSAAGKISGKMLHDGVTETLTANSFSQSYVTNETGVAYVSTNAVVKTASGTRPATVTVVADAATGESKMTVTVAPAEVGGEELSVEAWKGHAAAADARAGESIAAGENVTLLIGANGTAKAVGTWGTYRAVVSAIFVGDGKAFVYFPPNAGRRFDGWFKVVAISD